MASGFPLPYYAVIFSSKASAESVGYSKMAAHMLELASQQPGYLGYESVREDAHGITVSYWETEEAVTNWKSNLKHQAAQAQGRAQWYADYTVRVAKVEREYGSD